MKERNLKMKRIKTIDLKTETEALEAGHGITLYTFYEYDRLIHYAHVIASTPKERADGYADYFLTIFKGGDDMRRFDPDNGNDYPDLESIIESIKTIWHTPIWWERDGSVPGVDAGITFHELRGADMLDTARQRFEKEMRVRGINPDGLNAITPSFFELFEDYIAEEDSQLAADGVELETRTAWMSEMYRAMLNMMKN